MARPPHRDPPPPRGEEQGGTPNPPLDRRTKDNPSDKSQSIPSLHETPPGGTDDPGERETPCERIPAGATVVSYGPGNRRDRSNLQQFPLMAGSCSQDRRRRGCCDHHQSTQQTFQGDSHAHQTPEGGPVGLLSLSRLSPEPTNRAKPLGRSSSPAPMRPPRFFTRRQTWPARTEARPLHAQRAALVPLLRLAFLGLRPSVPGFLRPWATGGHEGARPWIRA